MSEDAPSPAAPVLEVDGLSASYGPYRALFDVTLSVPQGAVVALLGANGAGKSTLARVVSGLVPPTSGSLRFAGGDVTGFSAHRIARLGLVHVPEGRGVFGTLSVEENLLLALRERVGRRRVGEALERTYEAFPVLAERRRSAAAALSGGQQRILSLARVLVVPTRLLVVDELSFGLAPVVLDALYDALAAIHEAGTALLVVEQHVDRVLAFASDAVLLAKGRVIWQGPAAEATAAAGASLAPRP